MTTLYCSFCGKSQHEVAQLVAGPTVHICNECTDLCYQICNPPSAPKEQHAIIDAIWDKIGDVRRRANEAAAALLQLSSELHDVCEDFVAELDDRPVSGMMSRIGGDDPGFNAEIIGFGEALAGWAEAVATPDEDVGFVFTPLEADFTGLPVEISIGDDTPLVIAAPRSLTPETAAAVRHWVVEHQAILVDHWRNRIDSLQLIERLRQP
jgi:hypothetical protein